MTYAERIIETTRRYWEQEMSLMLTPDELKDLTHYTRPAAQIRALRAMGIDHKVRPDGSVAVLRSHVEGQMGAPKESRKTVGWEPNWSAA